jgi:hypothetical protein
MNKLAIAFLSIVPASAAQAQHTDLGVFMNVPVVGEIGMIAMAIGAGLVGTWGIKKYRSK